MSNSYNDAKAPFQGNSGFSESKLGKHYKNNEDKAAVEQVFTLVHNLSKCVGTGRRHENELMHLLRTLRNCIQSRTIDADTFAQAGAIPVLLKHLDKRFERQGIVLQILASLGYLVQSDNRAEIFVKENGIDELVRVLRSDHSSEAACLLAVQVVWFVVHDSNERLELLHSKRGIDTMCSILQRGCRKTVMLNDKATQILVKLIDLNPRRGPALCCRLLKRISQLVARYDAWECAAPSVDGYVNNQLVILIQSLGTLLENKPERCDYILTSRESAVLIKLLDQRKSSPKLIEVVTWTLLRCMEGSTERTLRIEGMDASLQLLEIVKTCETNEKLMSTCSKALRQILVALEANGTMQDKATFITDQLKLLLLTNNTESKFAVPNSLRVVRQLTDSPGAARTVLTDAGIFDDLVTLVSKASAEDEALQQKYKQDVLQEIGFMVQSNEFSALNLSEAGVLDALCRIITTSKDRALLCSATRAVACFVKYEPTLIACIKAGCDTGILGLLERRNEVGQEVLVNAVAALVPLVLSSAASEEVRDKTANALLVALESKSNSPSLQWNIALALVRLRDVTKHPDRFTAALQSKGLKAFETIILQLGENKTQIPDAEDNIQEEDN